jgi:Holliday junction resolvasome RuvABC endonuclease subunit
MALAIGTVSAAIELLGLPVEWVTPTEVKQVATGMRSASKDEMMDACRKSFKFDGFPKNQGDFRAHCRCVLGLPGRPERRKSLQTVR